MPLQAWALVSLFTLCSIVLGALAVRLLARAGGPRGATAYILPIVAAFGALYLIGHRLGISIGPEIPMFDFQVALIGDLAIGLAAALVVAAGQTLIVRARREPSAGSGA